VSYFEYAMDNGADVISCSWHAQAVFFPLSMKVWRAEESRNGGR
jgi:hypothetical protein